LPKLYSTPELNIDVSDDNKFKIIEEFSQNCNLEGEKIIPINIILNKKFIFSKLNLPRSLKYQKQINLIDLYFVQNKDYNYSLISLKTIQ